MELLTPGTGLIIWQLIVFVLLFFLLAKLAWKPIINSLKEREKSIQEALDTAEKARMEMSRLKADNENLLKQAREEREKILRDAREASNRIKDEAQADAKKAADRIIEEARAAIIAEKSNALKEVKALVANLSLEIAEKILQRNLADDKAQKSLAQEYIKDLKLN
ncbi:F0F1 ATP synthase subunit B [Chryseolinea sp. H1M3-3]|uniref:F0F1 ATP synthase subunit B n=1 Tax=Chryseolinea sp. H1M3-3 TaxID=3034144 RepID=UPI0023ED6B9E|nr:F0F1 ATP synthase subunit B [Chryseolinea sp. H1M3-3]